MPQPYMLKLPLALMHEAAGRYAVVEANDRMIAITRADDGEGVARALVLAANAMPAIARVLHELEDRDTLLTALAFDHKRELWVAPEDGGPDFESFEGYWLDCQVAVGDRRCVFCDAEADYEQKTSRGAEVFCTSCNGGGVGGNGGTCGECGGMGAWIRCVVGGCGGKSQKSHCRAHGGTP